MLLEVAAAGVDRGARHLMTGQPHLARPMGSGLRAPSQPVPGGDVAGRVVAVGADVSRFRPGDEVFGIDRGSFAQYAAADEDKLAPRPDDLTAEQAPALVPLLSAVADGSVVIAVGSVLLLATTLSVRGVHGEPDR